MRLDEVGERQVAQPFSSWAAAVAAQADRQSPIPAPSEEIQEVLVPTPGGVPRSVDEQQWDWMRFTHRSPIDNLEHRNQRIRASRYYMPP